MLRLGWNCCWQCLAIFLSFIFLKHSLLYTRSEVPTVKSKMVPWYLVFLSPQDVFVHKCDRKWSGSSQESAQDQHAPASGRWDSIHPQHWCLKTLPNKVLFNLTSCVRGQAPLRSVRTLGDRCSATVAGSRCTSSRPGSMWVNRTVCSCQNTPNKETIR